MWAQGYLDRPQMARASAAIRAEDLIYSSAVRRYFLGHEDLPTDIGVWNGDAMRMPSRMHSEYLRGLFPENRLTAGRFAVEGRAIALKDIASPMFVIGTETDHIAPWQSVCKARLFTDCDLAFPLTKGGHNGGILSEPGHPRRHFRIGHREAGALYVDPETWPAAAHPQKGSCCWPQYAAWLTQHSGAKASPPHIRERRTAPSHHLTMRPASMCAGPDNSRSGWEPRRIRRAARILHSANSGIRLRGVACFPEPLQIPWRFFDNPAQVGAMG